MADLIASPHVFAFGASNGFLFGRTIADEAELLTLAVDPAARRQGIGLDLVTRFLNRARQMGATSAFLEVAADNTAAIALYERCGFVAAGVRKGYYAEPDGRRTDALILTRTL